MKPRYWKFMGVVMVFAVEQATAQGSLTPPGAPGVTMKTLEQVEPRTDVATVAGDSTYHHVINQPGSYYLSGNLAVTNANGIHITAAGVTLDLNGFRISRATGSGGYGVYSTGTPGVTVRNGTIVGFGYGIEAWGPCLLEKLIVSECSAYGIHAGSDSRIIDCQAHNNAGSGIYAIKQSVLNGCLATYNGGTYGIYAGSDSSLNSCMASHNTGDYGIYAGSGSSLSGCTASYISGDGIYADSGSSLNNCTASDNGIAGIHAASGNTLNNCAARTNGVNGIYAGSGSTLNNCTAEYNGSDGIFASSSSTFSDCAAGHNSGDGIATGNGSRLSDCAVRANSGDGIQIGISTLVTDCTCSGNGLNGDGAGIHATGYSNRIEGNNVTYNDRGIDVDDNHNLIIRNSAAGNTTNYVIEAGNCVGPVVLSPTSGAISGNTGGSGVGSTDPWANFSF